MIPHIYCSQLIFDVMVHNSTFMINECHKNNIRQNSSVITRYNVCELAYNTYQKAPSPENLQDAFIKCEIYPLDSNDISWIHQRCSYKQKQIRNIIKGNWNHQHIQEKILIWYHHQNPGPSYILIEDSFDFTDADIDGEEIPETELCCLCRQFTPNKIRLGVDIELTKWVQCDNYRRKHWTHLKYCTSLRAVRRDTQFYCIHYEDMKYRFATLFYYFSLLDIASLDLTCIQLNFDLFLPLFVYFKNECKNTMWLAKI